MPLLVNDELLDEELVRSAARKYKERAVSEGTEVEGLDLDVRAQAWARENVIRQMIVRQAAGSRPPEALLDEIAAQVPRPKSKEIAEYYKRNRALFQRPEMVHAAHIVKNVDESATTEEALAAITAIEQQLQQGADFARLADQFSDCPGQGGELGFFASGEMVDEFESALVPLRAGEVTRVFRSPFGFHLAKLIERRPSRVPPLPEVHAEIEQQLWEQKKQLAVTRFIDGLRAAAVITRA
jgi:parvulin-like peptidyl-prolyl isomerase